MEPIKDMREFIEKLENMDELTRISKEVDPDNFELASYIMHMEDGPNKALLFERVKGSKIPVAANLFGNIKRLSLACGVKPTEEDVKKYRNDPHGGSGGLGSCSIRGYTLSEKERASLAIMYHKLLEADRLAAEGKFKPRIVNTGPCKEVKIKKEDIDLPKLFPLPMLCEKDAGPYINPGGLVIKDPDAGIMDVGCRRHLVKPDRYGKNRIGALIAGFSDGGRILKKYQERGLPCEVALFVGMDPAMEVANCYTSPHLVNQKDYNEYDIAGAIAGEPIEIVKCETLDLYVPATCEIVIEGIILPHETIYEGPMAEYTDVYAQQGPLPFIEITAITHRKDAIMHVLRSGRSEEHRTLSIPTCWGWEQMVFNELKRKFPSLKDAAILDGSHAFHLVASLKKRFEGEDRMLLYHILSTYAFKFATVVDEDIEPHNGEEVEWARCMRAGKSPDSYVILPKLHCMELDPAKDENQTATKLGILATLPFGEKYERAMPPKAMMEKTRADFEAAIAQ